MRLLKRRPPADPALVLLRSVCHELRPPMATLASLVQALEQQPSESRRCELTRLATQHAEHAEAVLERAAATAHGLAEPPDRALPLHRILPVAAAAVAADRLTVSASRAAMHSLVPPRSTRQILINLLSNAARHGPAAGAIHLRARVDWRRLRLTVADEGTLTAGLAEALRRRTPPPGSQGLGLWMVRHLAAGAGGTVRARDRTPYGLELVVTLPVRRH
jgi:signal transduction histidine kinase